MRTVKKVLLAITGVLFFITLIPHEALGARYTGRLVKGTWKKSWDETLRKQLFSVHGNTFLNHYDGKIGKVCPKYKASKKVKKLFWHQLFVSLAWKESLHGPKNYVNFRGGKNIGLYQINPKLRRAYGCPRKDLKNPYTNIQCAVKMARRLINREGAFLKGKKGGMAAYWQPLRSTSKLNRRNRNIILSSVTKACKTGRIAYLSTRKSPVYYAGILDFDTSFNTSGDLHAEELKIAISEYPDLVQKEARVSSSDEYFEFETDSDFIEIDPAVHYEQLDDIVEEIPTQDI